MDFCGAWKVEGVLRHEPFFMYIAETVIKTKSTVLSEKKHCFREKTLFQRKSTVSVEKHCLREKSLKLKKGGMAPV
jgi:hypothetical protein